MAIREGKWRCSFCSAENLGRDTSCQSCQAVRGEGVEFYLDEDAVEVQDENLIKAAKSGADWTCDYCQTDNRAAAQKCRQCGGERTDGGKTRMEKIVPLAKDGPPPVATPKNYGPLPAILTAALVAVALVVVYFLFFHTTSQTLVLKEGSWERSIGIESRVWVRKEAWSNDVPPNAHYIRTTLKQSGTKKIPNGTEKVKIGSKDLGNGMFEDVYEDRPVYKEEPVYDNWVEYEMMEWQEVRRIARQGNLGESPVWPQLVLNSGERQGIKIQSAKLILVNSKNRDFVYTLDPEQLAQFETGQTYIAKINAMGAVLSLK